MNSLERSLIEKAGADNGWEYVLEGQAEEVRLASAQHPATVLVSLHPEQAMRYALHFSQDIDFSELRRGLPETLFANGEISAFDDQTLALLLRRYAELILSLPERPLDAYEAETEKTLHERPELRGTEAERLVRQRIGQDVYRKALMKYWKGQCAITSISIPEVLKASHAKPWSDCETDSERLNVYNGFLLSANLDALFDSGLITFSDSGALTISNYIDGAKRRDLGLDDGMALRWIDEKHLPFLRWHRKRVFRKAT
jgi:putative restriction endonuclease